MILTLCLNPGGTGDCVTSSVIDFPLDDPVYVPIGMSLQSEKLSVGAGDDTGAAGGGGGGGAGAGSTVVQAASVMMAEPRTKAAEGRAIVIMAVPH